MFPTKNKHDLRTAYIYLTMLKEFGKSTEKLDEVKRAIREYTNKEKPFEHIVKDEGMDGYVILMELPAFLKSNEDAEEYFEDHHAIRNMPSAFDCTGRAFTSWYKVFRRRDKFFAYHSVGFDV